MMKGVVKQCIVCLCLFLFAGIFTSTFIVAVDTATHPHCISSSNAGVFQGSGINCFDQCDAECEPGHWYSWLCRGLCILGCSSGDPVYMNKQTMGRTSDVPFRWENKSTS